MKILFYVPHPFVFFLYSYLIFDNLYMHFTMKRMLLMEKQILKQQYIIKNYKKL